MLCGACMRVLEERAAANATIVRFCRHHETVAELQSAATDGCYACRQFWNTLPRAIMIKALSETAIGGQRVFTTSSAWRPDSSEKVTLIIDFGEDDKPFHKSWVDLLPPDDLIHLETTSAIHGSTGSETSWQCVQNWIHSCSTLHERCMIDGTQTQWYPARLIRLQGNSLRIIDTASNDLEGVYLTLSHCWGDKQPFKLTTGNHARLTAGFSIQELPRTFQDFDSDEDWLKESSCMNLVYGSVFCNIAATGAENSFAGLFQNRDPRQIKPEAVDVPFSSTKSELLYKKSKLADGTYQRSNLVHSPLLRRAWVLQERLLARRNLHFGRHEIIFECCSLLASETYPRGLPPFMNPNENEQGISLSHYKGFKRGVFHTGTSSDTGNKLALWNRVVAAYSLANLTFQRDKAAALSGIVKDIRDMMGVPYLAGFWHVNVHSQLGWGWQNVAGDETKTRRSKGYRAPSFSWLSVDGPVSVDIGSNDIATATVIELSVEPLSDDETGLSKSGYIRMKGLLQKFKIHHRSGVNGEPEIEALLLNSYTPVPNALFWWFDDYQDECQENPLEGYLLALSYRNDKERRGSALILSPVESSRGVFKRLGMVTTSKNVDIISQHHPDEANFPCESYDTENKQHFIKII